MAKQHSNGRWCRPAGLHCGAYMPFGGSSCPSIFSAYALTTKWILARYSGFDKEDIFNMLDDNLFLSAPGPIADGGEDKLGKSCMVYKEGQADRIVLSLGWRLKPKKCTAVRHKSNCNIEQYSNFIISVVKRQIQYQLKS